MINRPFIYTNHAKQRLDEHFPGLTIKKSTKKITNCNKIEINELRSTKAFKSLKQGKRTKFHFYKNELGAYFICEAKPQASDDNKFSNVIVTVISPEAQSNSFIDDDFKKQMIEAEYRLKESSALSQNEAIKKEPKKKKKKTKSKPKQAVYFEHPKNTKIGLLERNFHKISKIVFFRELNLNVNDFDINDSDLINRYLNMIDHTNAALKRFKTNISSFSRGKKTRGKKNIGVESTNIGVSLVNESIDYSLKGFSSLKVGIDNLLIDCLKSKTESLNVFYEGSGSFAPRQYNDSYNFAKSFTKLNIKTDGLLSKYLSEIVKYQTNVELNSVYKEDVLLTKARLVMNLEHLDFYSIYLSTPELMSNFTNIRAFYNTVVSKMDELEEDSFYILDYL